MSLIMTSADGLPFTPLALHVSRLDLSKVEPRDWQVLPVGPDLSFSDECYDPEIFERYCDQRMAGQFD